MKDCGRRFHNEVGKFKFLNELVKVISPKVCNKTFKGPIYSEIHMQCRCKVCIHLSFST